MTISSEIRKAGPFLGNGVTTSFAFAFKVFAKTDIKVTLLVIATGIETTLVLDSDYSVTLNADQNNNPGGSVTYPISGGLLPDTKKLTISSVVPFTQGTDIQNMGGFYPEVIENALDRVTITGQQSAEKLDRSIRYPVSDPLLGVELPAKDQRASKFLAFDAGGNPIASSGVSSTPVTAFWGAVLDDATLAASLASMGLSATIQSFIQAANAVAARITLGLVIGTDVQAYTVPASKIEMETGTETALRSMSPLNVKQAVAALGLTSSSVTATASGTSHDYTNIPSTVKRIAISFSGISTNGTSPAIIQLGSSGGIETSGYSGSCGFISGPSVNAEPLSSGFQLQGSANIAATTVVHGTITLTLLNASTNTWSASGILGDSTTNRMSWIGSSKTLAGLLDRIRLTTMNGTDVFDAGSFSLLYE